MTIQVEKGLRFRDLHTSETFIVPNAWDRRSARSLELAGFTCLGITRPVPGSPMRAPWHTIDDVSYQGGPQLYPIDQALEHILAAREGADRLSIPVTLLHLRSASRSNIRRCMKSRSFD